MREAFSTAPRFHHHDKSIAEKLHAGIRWLNLNNNSYPNPRLMSAHLTETGLPVYFEGKASGIRNECPQGDLSYFLPTIFDARIEKKGEIETPVVIKNLKDRADIPKALRAMLAQDQMPGFRDFAMNFDPARRQ